MKMINNLDRKQLKIEIDVWLADYFNNKGTYNKIIYEAMEYSINVGGKRIRPILMILVYSMFKEEYSKIMPVACALEMIHTYSLIHDDLPCMDNDDLRRGKPTNHKVYGEALAVLAGDALLNEALSILFQYCEDKNKNVLKACRSISIAAGADGMIGGQVVDIISEGRQIDLDTLLYMHRKKTGALIKTAIVSGALIGEADDEEISFLEEYGEKLGLAFQIKDDILDITGNKNILGKNVGSDKENNKTTFITQYGLEKCESECKNLTEECIKILNHLKRDTTYLKELTYYLLERES